MSVLTLKPRVALYTIGCRLNQAESGLLVDGFKTAGYTPVPFGEQTDILVVNACSVTEGAEADCRHIIRRVLRTSPHAFVVVTGCYAQTGVESLRTIPGIDLILGNQFKMRLPEFLQTLPSHAKRTSPVIRHTRKLDHEPFTLEGTGECVTTRANLKIQDGCQFMCSFCLIPFARGRERSRRFDDAIREAEMLAERGHQELVLTGVNIGQYRENGSDLLTLIQRLETISGVKRIRISSIEPTTVSESLVEYMKTSPKLCRHLHVPLQSGDDAILKSMNRRYTVRDYAAWVKKVALDIPGICLGTDVMVGFPGEGEREFSNTQSFVSDLPFAYLHVFSYSKRPGTAAVKKMGAVSAVTIKSRSRQLAKVSRQKRLAFSQQWIGKTMNVLFEAPTRPGIWTGLTDNYIRVGVSSSEALNNTFQPVTLTGMMGEWAVGYLDQESPSLSCAFPFSLLDERLAKDSVTDISG